MNLVAGVTSFPVSAGLDVSLARSEDMIHRIEVHSQGDLAVVLQRNLLISQGLCVVDALLLAVHVWEVLNFKWWEQERVAKEVLAQDWVVKWEMDCFGDSVAK